MTADGLAALLSSLGDTPDAVAETLRREGCAGTRGHCWGCPVSLFLRKRTGLRAGSRALRCDVEPPGSDPVSCETPPPVRLFVRLFDLGEYPELSNSPASP